MNKNILLAAFVILFFSTNVFSQNKSSRKQEEDPTLLSKLQGTWMNTTPGKALWYKVQISDKVCKIWISSPKTGHWNDGASANDPTICDITGCYKITDRNEYDGKLQSESLALTIRRGTGREGYTLNLHTEGGQTFLRIMDYSSTGWTVLKKVSAKYSPWN